MRMIKRLLFVFCIVIGSFLFSSYVFASEVDTLIDRQLDIVDLDSLTDSTKDIIENSDNEYLKNFNFTDFVKKVITGEIRLSFSEILNIFFKEIFKEIYSQLFLIQRLVLISILSALLKNLNASFNGKSVGELSFYVCYIVLIFIIMASFQTGAQLVNDLCSTMITAMQAMLPIFTALMFSSGSYTQLAVVGPVIIGASQLISTIISTMVLPAITLVTTLHMLNYISEKSILSQMSDLLKSMISWGLKGISIGFMTMVSLQKIGAPALNKVLGKTAKVAVGAIPIVGDVMTGAVEMAATLSGAVKSGVLVSVIVFIILLCMIPLIKLVVMILIYKFTAALLEPVCESRLVRCISAAGDFSVLLLSALFTVEVMFIFSVIILLSTA